MIRAGLDVSAIPEEPRGAGRYVIELVRALSRRGNVQLSLEARRGDVDRWTGTAPGARISGVVPDARLRRLAWEQIAAPRFVDRWGIDVFHGPHYTMPEIAKVPKVVTIHDLTFFTHPEWHEKVKVSLFTRAIKVAVKRADALVCVSAPTARCLDELLSPRQPVHVITHGVDHDRFRPDDPDGRDAERIAALGLPVGEDGVTGHRRYIAFLGTLEPRKNVAGLVAAFDRIAADHPDVVLAIVGGSGWRNGQFERAVAASPFADRIARTGYVPLDSLPSVIRGATALVYPALEEGFGLPALEALACGTPAVTTAGSVMDEVTEGVAYTVPPGDVTELASCIESLLTEERDEERVARGLAVAAAHTWDANAEAHERVYAEVAR